MRDYSQYSITPTKQKTNNGLVATPSPASSASFPNTQYRTPSTATKSQVAVLNTKHRPVQVAHHSHSQHHYQKQQQHHQQQPRRDSGSINTVATHSQSSNDHSPTRSNNTCSTEEQQNTTTTGLQHQPEPQKQQHKPPPSHHQTTTTMPPSSQYPKNHLHQKYPQQPSSSPPTTNISISSSSVPARDLTSLTPADALSLKRDGPEATILLLRQALEEARVRDAAEKSSITKSDATILELRSSVRQLKRQLEKIDGEARQKHTDLVAAKQELVALKQKQQHQLSSRHNTFNDSNAVPSVPSRHQHSLAREEHVGELQVQLDRAHAQILTADMVRKELEDTLEAEQYTWELRVQDQERTIVELQREVGVLTDDLDKCRLQWKQADEQWGKKVAILEHQRNNGNDHELVASQREQLKQLEQERNELQTCLDEALLELEAVDDELGSHTPAEVQQLRAENQRLQEAVHTQRQLQAQQQLQQGDADFDTLEGLRHLYRWLLERYQYSEEEKKSDTMPQTSPELLDCIHRVLEAISAADLSQKVTELENQLTVSRRDLQAREESSAELRSSLKEAVELIKPLQDAVDKAGQQKADLHQEMERLRAYHERNTHEMQQEQQGIERSLKSKEQECQQLQHNLHRLQVELEDAKELTKARQNLQGLSPTAAAAAAAAQKTRPPTEQPQQLSSLSKARADLKAKRAQEQTLRSLLRDAQNRFHTLNRQNQSVEALNQKLQGRLRDVEEQQNRDEGISEFSDGPPAKNVADWEKQVAKLKQALEEKCQKLDSLNEQTNKQKTESIQRMQELESNLSMAERELQQKVVSETVLTNNLKEALGLLKPLKNHLEEAEAENKELSKEVRTLRRKVTSMEISGMGTVVASHNNNTNNVMKASTFPQVGDTPTASNSGDGTDEKALREKEQLEETVRHLEQENSQLHDALDELSRMNNSNMSGIDRFSPDTNGDPHTPKSGLSSKAEARLNQEIVELRSRYEVTQSRLEDAYVENHTLVETLKEMGESENAAIEGMRILREKLRKTEMDLENAKYIATSALVKVEQAKSLEQNTSSNSAFEGESHTVHSLEEKAIELDLLASAGIRPSQTSRNSNMNDNPQQQQKQAQFSADHQQLSTQKQDSNTVKGWAGKRSRLADF